MPAQTKRSNRYRKGPHYAHVWHRRDRRHRICRCPRTPRNRSLRAGATKSDGVIQLAFNSVSDTTDFPASLQADLRAVETIGATLEDSGKPFVVTSGTLISR
jgi:hypothetical protein